jgi:hypothetical protein
MSKAVCLVLLGILVFGVAGCKLAWQHESHGSPNPPAWIHGNWYTTDYYQYCGYNEGQLAYSFSSDAIGQGYMDSGGRYHQCSVMDEFPNDDSYDRSTATTYELHIVRHYRYRDDEVWDYVYSMLDDGVTLNERRVSNIEFWTVPSNSAYHRF